MRPAHITPAEYRAAMVEAMVEAMERHINGLRTEPMTLADLCHYFALGRRKMRVVVAHMADVETVGTRYRLRLKDMPPRYHCETGLISNST